MSAIVAVNQGSAILITFNFTDAAGAPVVPVSLMWSLSDEKGSIINGRSDVVVAVPTNPYSIILNGADTQLIAGPDTGRRVLSIAATYSSSYGTLNLNEEFRFDVSALVLGGM